MAIGAQMHIKEVATVIRYILLLKRRTGCKFHRLTHSMQFKSINNIVWLQYILKLRLLTLV